MSRETLAIVRAILGLAQGAALYLLYNAATATRVVEGDMLISTPLWPATDAQVFAPLVLTAVFVPALAIAGLGNLRMRTFAVWIAAAAVIVAALGAYDVFHDPAGDLSEMRLWRPRVSPVPLWVATAAGLFIAHALVVSGDADRGWIARYPRYFEAAWKQAVQVVLVGIFLGAVMMLLFLAAGLLQLIQIRFSDEPWRTPWFTFPVGALAFALALHVTDVQVAIVRGVRALTLTVLSGLLLLVAAVATGFLTTLLLTRLDPLWGTRRAAAIALGTAAALIVLINAAYREGGPRAHPVTFVPRYAGIVAAVALTPLVAIAAYAVLLRVTQYGWTPARIVAMACVVVVACHAIGYGLAAVMSSP